MLESFVVCALGWETHNENDLERESVDKLIALVAAWFESIGWLVEDWGLDIHSGFRQSWFPHPLVNWLKYLQKRKRKERIWPIVGC